MRKLDKTGADLIEPADITEFADSSAIQFEIHSDIKNNIYIRAWNTLLSKRIIIFQPDGSDFTILNADSRYFALPFSFIKLPNGNVASTAAAGNDMDLLEIDAETGKWGRTITLPGATFGKWPIQGIGEYPVLYFRGSQLTGYDPDSRLFTEIFSPPDAGITFTFLYSASVLEDGRIMLITDTIYDDTENFDTEIVYITKMPFDPTEKTIITVAAYRLSLNLLKPSQYSTGRAVRISCRSSIMTYTPAEAMTAG